MKKLLFLFLSIAILLPACRDDDGVVFEDLIQGELQYDGDNLSAPILNQGTSVAAAFFPASFVADYTGCLLYTSPSPRDQRGSRMPSSA